MRENTYSMTYFDAGTGREHTEDVLVHWTLARTPDKAFFLWVLTEHPLARDREVIVSGRMGCPPAAVRGPRTLKDAAAR